MNIDVTPSEARLYHVVDRLRDDVRREIDLRLQSEADASQLALTALERGSLTLAQIVSLITSIAALLLSAIALWWKH